MSSKNRPSQSLLERLAALLEWYQSARREFPWRTQARPDAYMVWIVEVMSQQSTMTSVLPYFRRWMDRFPTIDHLAGASEDEVLSMWAGLGYYSRARNVHRAAKLLTKFRDEHQGRWPERANEWQELPGVGPYTAAAVASIAFDEPVVPVDGNVLRVMSRFWGVADPLNQAADREAIEKELVDFARYIPLGSRGAVAQALMELGSQVCRPSAQAQCEACPLQSHCQAGTPLRAAALPRAKLRAPSERIVSVALLYRGPQGEALLRKIPEPLRLSGQWELPLWEFKDPEEGLRLVADLGQHYAVQGPVKHSITRFAYEVYLVEAGPWEGELPAHHAYQGSSTGVLTTLTRKLLRLLESSGSTQEKLTFSC